MTDYMDEAPDFSTYTLYELNDALRTLDADTYPERALAIMAERDKRIVETNEANKAPVVIEVRAGLQDTAGALYTPTQALVGVFFGYPIALFYFVFANFRTLNNATAARNTEILGWLIVLVLALLTPFLPESTPYLLVALIFAISARMAVEKYHCTKEEIEASDALSFHSNWRVLLVTIFSWLAFFALAFIVTVIMTLVGWVELSET